MKLWSSTQFSVIFGIFHVAKRSAIVHFRLNTTTYWPTHTHKDSDLINLMIHNRCGRPSYVETRRLTATSHCAPRRSRHLTQQVSEVVARDNVILDFITCSRVLCHDDLIKLITGRGWPWSYSVLSFKLRISLRRPVAASLKGNRAISMARCYA